MRFNKAFGLFDFSGDCLLGLNNFKPFFFLAVNVTVSCNVLSRWAKLVSVFSRKDSDIQISKNGLQLKLILH